MTSVLVHLASGIGNVVLATPLLIALDRLGLAVDVVLDADYADTADLLRGWAIVRAVVDDRSRGSYDAIVAAVPPFYWARFAKRYRRETRTVPRPPDALFYTDEQEYYVTFARRLGFVGARPTCALPIGPSDRFGVGGSTVVLAPGCKSGEMSAKRWPGFAELAARFDDVAVVGMPDDLRVDGRPLALPRHARSFVGALGLRDTAELLATAGVVVANDSGLAHVSAAVGTPTVIIFGPTPHQTLGALPPNASVVRAGLPCEPCWFSGARFAACARRIDCLRDVSVDLIERQVRALQRTREVVAC
ncbi:MAG TPA: glycosyltransferase family 9 protein [Vicinamibacterales bacterium]|nr:glycosyltransferase family 9 protein [Vicinamibacterales bacterium]